MHPESDSNNHEYTVHVSTSNIHEAIASAASALYTLVEEGLAAHQDHEAEECEFEEFARDILAVLGRHADQLSEGEGLEDGLEAGDQDDPYD